MGDVGRLRIVAWWKMKEKDKRKKKIYSAQYIDPAISGLPRDIKLRNG